MTKAINFQEELRVRAPKGLNEALRIAARRRSTTPSEWARQALLLQLEGVGVCLRDGVVQEVKAER